MKLPLSLILFCMTSLSFGQTNISGDNLINAFKQGKRGNCASIALIKAAISVYGIDNVFTERTLTDRSFEATLKNGKKYFITNSELILAKKSADFKAQTENAGRLIEYSAKCYAIMAKARQEIHGFATYAEALKRLDRGAYTPTIYLFLGLENKFKAYKRGSDINDKCGIVAWRTKHAVFSCNGYIDNYGKKEKITRKYYGRFQILD